MLEKNFDAARHDASWYENFTPRYNRITSYDAPQDGADMQAPEYQLFNDLFTDYLAAPKRLGTLQADWLRICAIQALAYPESNTVSKTITAQAYELAGSALWESAFVQSQASHNSIESVDQRLGLIDAYEVCTQAAQRLYAPDTAEHHRLSMRSSFVPVMQDVVCGDVSNDTVNDIRTSLENHVVASSLIKNGQDAEGFVGELKVLLHYWNTYSHTGDPVAIPSTYRAGSGVFNPEETHDISLIRQRKDASWVVTSPVEVKKREIRTVELQRYIRSLLAYVAPDGTVSFINSHRRNEHGDESHDKTLTNL
jgi:hypothetical protein